MTKAVLDDAHMLAAARAQEEAVLADRRVGSPFKDSLQVSEWTK